MGPTHIQDINIMTKDVEDRISTMLSWEVRSLDRIQRFGLKKFSYLHDKISQALNEWMPEWMVKGKQHSL